MIDFSKIEKYSFSLDLFKTYIRFAHNRIFYRKCQVIGRENIPPKGTPFIIVGNHANGLMDGLGIHFALPLNQGPVFLASGNMFDNKLAARFLLFVKILPMYRIRKRDESVEENQGSFRKASELILNGHPVALFPEDEHLQGHRLARFKKGFARIAFDAAKADYYRSEILILPVGNHYSNYLEPRSERLLHIGKPIRLSDFYDGFRENDSMERNRLAEVARTSVEKLILTINDTENYDVIDRMRSIVRPTLARKLGLNFRQLSDALKTDQTLMLMIREQPGERKKDMFRMVQEYEVLLQKTKGSVPAISKPKSVSSLSVSKAVPALSKPKALTSLFEPKALSALLWKSLAFLLGFPLFLYGALFGCLPWALAVRAAHKLTDGKKDRILFTSVTFGLSHVVLYPIQNLLLTLVVMILTHSFWWGLLFFFTLFSTRIFAADYFRHLKHHVRMGRSWFLSRRKDSDYQSLCEKHQQILELVDTWFLP
jgi:1-acyl-sn-glycerol-3-phosphate acyltransferase